MMKRGNAGPQRGMTLLELTVVLLVLIGSQRCGRFLTTEEREAHEA